MKSISFLRAIIALVLITQTQSTEPNAVVSNSDPCSQELNSGSCNKQLTRYYFDSIKSDCISFTWTGCDQNENNFPSKQDCVETCAKSRAPRRVPQDISYKMLSDFEWTPPGSPSSSGNVRRRFPLAFCDLEKDMGILCSGIRRGNYLEQFHYDTRTNRCNPFVYNGCGGNANRFATIWECTQSCVRKTMQRF